MHPQLSTISSTINAKHIQTEFNSPVEQPQRRAASQLADGVVMPRRLLPNLTAPQS